MRRKLTRILAGLAALVAFALGGATLASAGQGGAAPTKPPAAVASVQSNSAKADAETNDTPGKADANGSNAADTDSIQSENGKDDATEQPGAESGSEVATNDGPGGHADEPGNAQADHQFEGQE